VSPLINSTFLCEFRRHASAARAAGVADKGFLAKQILPVQHLLWDYFFQLCCHLSRGSAIPARRGSTALFSRAARSMPDHLQNSGQAKTFTVITPQWRAAVPRRRDCRRSRRRGSDALHDLVAPDNTAMRWTSVFMHFHLSRQERPGEGDLKRGMAQ